MMAIELFDKNDAWGFQNNCILIQEVPVPEMYPEYAPGPPDNDPFPEYWNTGIGVYYISTATGTCKELTATMMKDFYKYVYGMKNRKLYWRIMKYLESCGR